MTIKTDKHGAPDHIWLQLHGDVDPETYGPIDVTQNTGEITWCWEPIFDHDVRYVRADLNGWISVKERLPEFDMPVLGCCRIYGRSVRVYSEIYGTGAGHWDDPITGKMGGLPPTHWIPLPQLPEES